MTLWDYINQLNNKEEITLRVQVYDARFYMPMMATINLKLNRPPEGGTVIVEPSEGVGFETEFSISAKGFLDTNQPLTYKFSFYQTK